MSYPTTAVEALTAWDNGDTVWVPVMGGLGPGYEQAIYVLMFEILRDVPMALATDASTDAFQKAVDDVVRRLSANPDYRMGLSGAQVGAASFIAFRTMRDGWANSLEKIKKDDPERMTLVSRAWPNVPVPVAHV